MNNKFFLGLCVTYTQRKVKPSNQSIQFRMSNNRIIVPVMQRTIRIKSKSRLNPSSMIKFFSYKNFGA
jgi:hypothetical protein